MWQNCSRYRLWRALKGFISVNKMLSGLFKPKGGSCSFLYIKSESKGNNNNNNSNSNKKVKVKVKQSHYRPGMAQRVPGC